ncbi:D-tyrosyl-tRNA(Tyr) deacylase [Corynebacterium sp. zg254]|uniref:D-aminoacyl-tRNA deacylase n=1 Tax=Corynebacterium zhongnanshanii TaxID=2768834 RepID=A0ABQ6VGK6_9CORY|nr:MULTISPECIES: D-aminoacyl-tRNA deacylase [Corynebacterium]KAB3523400.1 D-tyrosyl-tRNA(Tyr) deacylase [Corynebacterium zhongnanshanii]MCR5913471.1 D-tyrosyl-tRNA(Tyr) deacylase [Corynebacterium sp. zg254]
MKAVISTVSHASVTVEGEVVGEVEGPALLALIGAGREDSPDAWETVARKIAELRLFPERDAPWDEPRTHSALDVGAQILVVSQFTLMGATAKGRRPSWSAAAPGEVAEPIITNIIEALRARGLHVESGRFGAMMRVQSTNEGPYTVLVEAE